MIESSASAFPFFIPAGLVAIAFAATLLNRFLRTKVALPSPPEPFRGTPIRESGWGTASLNHVGVGNLVKLIEYPDGWLVRLRFSAGEMVWLPRETTQFGPMVVPGFPRRCRKTLVSGHNELTLFGHLAAFVKSS